MCGKEDMNMSLPPERIRKKNVGHETKRSNPMLIHSTVRAIAATRHSKVVGHRRHIHSPVKKSICNKIDI